MREPPAPLREQTQPAVCASPNDNPFWRRAGVNLAIAAAAGAFMAIVGAFETDQSPLWRRLLYWIPMMMSGALLGGFVSSATLRSPRASHNPWVQGALITLGVAAPGAFFVWIYTAWFFGFAAPLSAFPGFFGTVLVVSAAMTAIMMAVNRPGLVTHAAAPNSASTAVRFLERLPAKLKGGALYAVQAEDHYLRLHTSKGQDLILLRLGDAIAELDGVEGAQTHRSWWVAKDAVSEVKRDNGRVALVLANGAEAPVSRPNVRALREAGWI